MARQSTELRVRSAEAVLCLEAIMNLLGEVKRSTPLKNIFHLPVVLVCGFFFSSSDLPIIHSRKEYLKSRSAPIHTVWNTYKYLTFTNV